MTSSELISALGATAVCGDGEREVECGYACDLLSWAMSRAPAGCAWITVMSNVNVVAVASLADVACVILAEGAELDADALEKARAQGVTVALSPEGIYGLCCKTEALLSK